MLSSEAMSLSAPIARMSFAEYIAFEENSDTKHEFLGGEVFAMAGGTIEHGALSSAVIIALGNALRDRPFRVLNADVRVRVLATGLVTYPDVSVVCGRLEVDPENEHTVVNPIVLVEVLSDSTEAYDRGAKSSHYRRIPSLREIVLVSQREPLIEVHRRNERGNWELVTEARAGSQAELASIGAVLDVDVIYRNPLDA
jgi:Uma2 family endonuclease